MPHSTVKTTAPGVQNPYGTYVQKYNSHRIGEMYANPSNHFSVPGGTNKQASAKPSKKGY